VALNYKSSHEVFGLAPIVGLTIANNTIDFAPAKGGRPVSDTAACGIYLKKESSIMNTVDYQLVKIYGNTIRRTLGPAICFTIRSTNGAIADNVIRDAVQRDAAIEAAHTRRSFSAAALRACTSTRT
jgi:hypothetical protein